MGVLFHSDLAVVPGSRVPHVKKTVCAFFFERAIKLRVERSTLKLGLQVTD